MVSPFLFPASCLMREVIPGQRFAIVRTSTLQRVPCGQSGERVVMEKMIRGRMVSCCRKLKIVPPEQHGFLPGASTTTNLMDSLFDWNLAINQVSSHLLCIYSPPLAI
ncbi:hypothetical protein GCK32_019064 [Trichostrongylus colubriformis]|uniref:Uncharacterized protein n=1 Tax=Trichostrongylus colubriformis TaxID=6319 RepID=A0AAN8IC39_TRICO